MDRQALAAFLRSRRDALHPGDVGLPASTRRRVRGLRREEVAYLSAMSVDYYSRLERGSGSQPSTTMLDVLARTLRMTIDEREHLYRLAGHNVPDRLTGSPHVSVGLHRVLAHLSDTPAFIVSDLGITLSQNALATALFGDHRHFQGDERSSIFRWFTNPEAERSVYLPEDRDRQGRALVSALRVAVARNGAKSAAAKLQRTLSRQSAEFAEIWARQEVTRRFEDHKALVHPEVGTIQFDCQALFTEDETQTLVVLSVSPGGSDAERVQLVGVLGQGRFGGPPGAGEPSTRMNPGSRGQV